MKKLTLETALEHRFTVVDCVRFFNNELTFKECEFILWEHTCYPYGFQLMIKQLNEYFENESPLQ
jgi:hypothetical protein